MKNSLLGNFFVKERDIWYVQMGQNIGSEENGKQHFLRPVIVIKKVGNLFFTVALTTQGKFNHPFYYHLEYLSIQMLASGKSSFVILSQVKVMDKKRFVKKIGSVDKKEYIFIQQKLRELLL